jgi:hypothetical protein
MKVYCIAALPMRLEAEKNHLPQRSQSTQRVSRITSFRQHISRINQFSTETAFVFLCDLCVLCGLNLDFCFELEARP